MGQKKEAMMFPKQLQSQAANLSAREKVSTQGSSQISGSKYSELLKHCNVADTAVGVIMICDMD